MKKMFLIFNLIGLITLLFLFGCTTDNSDKGNRVELVDSASRPDTEGQDAQILLYDKGRVTTEILAKKIYKFEEIDSTMGYQLDIDFYDSTGHIVSEVVGDSGIFREKTNKMSIYGNVVVVSEDSTILETDYLYWDPAKDKIYTDAFVKITKDGDIITGWGLEADQRLDGFEILNVVSSSPVDVEKLEE